MAFQRATGYKTSAAAAGGGAADARTIITRTYEITLAQLQAITGTTNTWALFTLGANEGIRWVWMENSGVAFTGATLYVEVGRSGDTDSLYVQRNLTASGKVEDDNANAGADRGAYREMGDSNATAESIGDGAVYYGAEQAIKCLTTTTGGNHDDLLGGGPIYIHVEIVRVSVADVVAAV